MHKYRQLLYNFFPHGLLHNTLLTHSALEEKLVAKQTQKWECCCFPKNWIIFPVFCAAGCAGSVQCKQSPCLWLRLRCWDNCVILKCTVLLNAAGKHVISSAVHKCSYHWLKWMRSILCLTLDCGWNGGGMSTTTTGHMTLRWGKDFKI